MSDYLLHEESPLTALTSLMSAVHFEQDGTTMLGSFNNPERGKKNLALPKHQVAILLDYPNPS